MNDRLKVLNSDIEKQNTVLIDIQYSINQAKKIAPDQKHIDNMEMRKIVVSARIVALTEERDALHKQIQLERSTKAINRATGAMQRLCEAFSVLDKSIRRQLKK